LALFYTPEPIPLSTDAEGVDLEAIELDGRREYVVRAIEEVLFPELRRRFIAVKGLITDKRVVEVADLPGLYRIFERC
jgi:DNA mismatch repair protein MLH1